MKGPIEENVAVLAFSTVFTLCMLHADVVYDWFIFLLTKLLFPFGSENTWLSVGWLAILSALCFLSAKRTSQNHHCKP